MPTLRPDLPPLPPGLASAPVAENGYPVPWFVPWVPIDPARPELGGRPEFRAADSKKLIQALTERRCWVCGGHLYPGGALPARGDYPPVTFVVGPMCTVNRVSAEPPSHYDCARFSAVACPFLSKPHMKRRENDMTPDEVRAAHEATAGVMLARNPGAMCLWTTRHYQAFAAPTGDGKRNGVLFDIGKADLGAEWFHGGRAATPVEVHRAIALGLPTLYGMVAGDAGGEEELGRKIDAARAYWPELTDADEDELAAELDALGPAGEGVPCGARDPNEPCKQCPFRRDVDPTVCEQKGSHPAEFVGQLFGPFFLPCHLTPGFKGDSCDPANLQCPGAATFRSNVGVWDRVELPAEIRRLPADRDRYFATLDEFVAHHMRCSPEAARAWLAVFTPERLAYMERRRAGVRPVALGAKGGA